MRPNRLTALVLPLRIKQSLMGKTVAAWMFELLPVESHSCLESCPFSDKAKVFVGLGFLMK